MLLIVGLGNPGSSYQDNRHNIGFMAAEAIHQHCQFAGWSQRFQAATAEGFVAGEKTLLLKPRTYMNLSGQAVGETLRFYKLPLEKLLVIHDDLDLAPGRVRLKTGGGSGGHNGIKSIDAHCGVAYRRLRLGVGRPRPGENVDMMRSIRDYVLGNFTKADTIWLHPLLEALGKHIGLLLQGKDSSFMNKLSLALQLSGKDNIQER